ncbi:hypothetical protein STRIP9103_07670 [Streptomyces ipomoeae 91-03]|uniref:Uncharacterized protein n=1 Tax=Streptomyces ipomoeae 91-03 TaxID=698759 RepID=L1L360_9ACTN|nr:hypothetical protein STRIP9103_07670 [Streptomyces ipomoeae 91-03]
MCSSALQRRHAGRERALSERAHRGTRLRSHCHLVRYTGWGSASRSEGRGEATAGQWFCRFSLIFV